MNIAPKTTILNLIALLSGLTTFAASPGVPPPPTTPPPPGLPIDGGIIILLIIAIFYSFYLFNKVNKQCK